MPGRTIVVVLGAAVWAACIPVAHAADAPKQTPFVTNESVEVPGMMLEPGRYVFRLVEPGTERNVLQVFEVVQLWTGDESRLLSTLLTMPNYDLPTTDKTVFSFFERGPKQAKAVRIWFPPGRNYGQEFVYPKAQAVELAKAVGRSVLSMPADLPGDVGLLTGGAQKGGPVVVPAPNSPMTAQPPANPVPIPLPFNQPSSQAAAPPVQSAGAAKDPGNVRRSPPGSMVQRRSRLRDKTPAREPEKVAANLPKTAGYLPIVAFLGIAGIAAGALLRILALKLER